MSADCKSIGASTHRGAKIFGNSPEQTAEINFIQRNRREVNRYRGVKQRRIQNNRQLRLQQNGAGFQHDPHSDQHERAAVRWLGGHVRHLVTETLEASNDDAVLMRDALRRARKALA